MIGNRGNAMILVAALALSPSACLLPPADSMGVVIQTAPPPERVEYYSAAPGPEYVWVTGYWQWNSTEYFWVPGRWAAPPRGYHAYERGRWQRTGHGWKWHEGKWRH